ncbi:MAG: DUF429 domain-containing protein [Rhodospirillaceae bacterium]
MLLFGVDFTSAPSPRKPIVVAAGTVKAKRLRVDSLTALTSHERFRAFLQSPGPWVGGFDFPFGLSRRFIETAQLPPAWRDYAGELCGLPRAGFIARLKAYRATRAPGDKEHRRPTDRIAGSVSPQKLENPPVGLMFYEGIRALLESGATIVPMHAGDPTKIALEAYPGALGRRLIGRAPYKSDDRSKQSPERDEARRELLKRVQSRDCRKLHGLTLDLPKPLARELQADKLGDKIDAVLCLIQAAWALGEKHYGVPADAEPSEGWIIAADKYLEPLRSERR